MKNNMKYLNNFRMIRPDAITLALIMFLQTISPVFVFGRNNEGRIKSYDAVFPIKNNHKSYASKSTKNNNLSFRTEAHLNEINPDLIVDINSPDKESKTELKEINLIKPGGPDQPEVQSFTAVGTDGMVDPFTGDFSYNIPLLEVDGYPVNLAYSAGIGMEQEASWVGLGWNVNPGVINRSMRGIPDDFSGDEIVQEYNQKANWTVGTSAGANLEVFGIDLGNVGVQVSLGIQYNNYSGFGTDVSIGPSFSIANKNSLEVGLQFSGSSQGGATIGANLSLSDGNKDFDDVVNKISIGSSFNSRQGLQQTSINLSREQLFESGEKNVRKNFKNEHVSTGLASSSFNHGMSTFVPQVRHSTTSNSFTGRFKLSIDIVGNDPSGTFTGFFSKSTLVSNTKYLQAYGYMNLQNGFQNANAMLDFNRENDGSFTKNTPALPIPHLMYDIYSVSGQGISGSYRMDRQDIGYIFDPKITSGSNSYSLGGEVGLGATFKAGVDVGAVFSKSSSGVWKDNNNASRSINYKSKINFFRAANELAFDDSDLHFNNIGGSEAAYFKLLGFQGLDNTLITTSNQKMTINNS